VALLLALAGCATSPATPASQPKVVWPAPPAVARVVRLGEIRTRADLGVRPGWFGRLLAVVAGGRRGPFLVHPMGVAVGEGGELLVTDPGNRQVLLLDPAHHRIRRLPKDESVPLPSPIAAVWGLHGEIFVSDSMLGRVLRFDTKGRYLGDLGNPRLLQRPTGMAVDRERGRIYVADTTGHQIFIFDGDGKVVRVIGHRGGQPGELNYPTHLCLDREGRLYVTDAMNFRIQVFDSSGAVVSAIGHLGDGPGSFSKPKGVAVDSEGHIYVVDALFDNVQILDRQGHPLLAIGGSGSGAAGFWLPTGIAIDGHDRIYVADTYNHRIQILQYHSLPEAP